MAIKMRLACPEAGNPYYSKEDKGGFNPCIWGNPFYSDANVLANCVGYAVGRFNEIGDWGSCKYLGSWEPYWMTTGAKMQGLTVSNTPQEGAMLVWQNHVEIVEKVINSSQILTSASIYGGDIFQVKFRYNNNGRWGWNTKFYGFILNPAVTHDEWIPQVGEKVLFKGGTHYTTANSSTGYKATAGEAKIAYIVDSNRYKHPYSLIRTSGSKSNVYGWVDRNTFEKEE